MHLSLAVTFLIAAATSGVVQAQSLQESYAKLCSNPVDAKSEACQILARSSPAKLQGQQTTPPSTTANAQPDQATRALWRKRWGAFLDLIGRDWYATILVSNDFVTHTLRYQWTVPGEEYTAMLVREDGITQLLSTTKWDEANQRMVTKVGDTSISHVTQADGSVLTTAAGGRSITRLLADGSVQTLVETESGGVSETRNVVPTPAALAAEQHRMRAAARASLAAAQEQKRAEQTEKSAKSSQRALMFNSVLEGLAQGVAEVDSGGYAEAQANLEATVADIQYAAAAERQQQNSQQQAQTGAAEVQRQQLADNARWVAEKEQAAAEHRSAQAEAAAAREEARVLAANAEAAAERARRAGVQRQQSAADATGTIVSQKMPAGAGISLLEGPKESGRGGSTCNEELACRKSCAGDVFAVTECVKQCARESACRVSIQ